jgi:hypothetical protein
MPESIADGPGKERRLESWGEIAGYLRREIRTIAALGKNSRAPYSSCRSANKVRFTLILPSLMSGIARAEPRDVKEDDFTDEPAVAPNHGSNPTDSATLTPSVETQSRIAIPVYRRKSTWLAGIAFLIVFGVLVTHSIFSFPSSTSSPAPVASSDGKIRLFVRPLQNIAENLGQRTSPKARPMKADFFYSIASF